MARKRDVEVPEDEADLTDEDEVEDVEDDLEEEEFVEDDLEEEEFDEGFEEGEEVVATDLDEVTAAEAGETEDEVLEVVAAVDDEEEVLVRVVEEDEDDDGDEDGLREGEFICSSCFLVKGPTQLADKRRLLCVDCV